MDALILFLMLVAVAIGEALQVRESRRCRATLEDMARQLMKIHEDAAREDASEYGEKWGYTDDDGDR